METITYRFPDEAKAREAARIIFRNICDNHDAKYTATTATSPQFTHQRFAVNNSQDEEVMFFILNAKSLTPYIAFTFMADGHKQILLGIINKVVETHEGTEVKPQVWSPD